MIKTITPGHRNGEVNIPSSKSVVHRLLLCAALGREPVSISYRGLSKDIRATADCLSALGANIQTEETELKVFPVRENNQSSEEVVLPAGESGSTLRFLLPVVGALGRKARFQMEGRLSERPLAPFDRVLSEHGMKISREGKYLIVDGQLESGTFELPGNISSQFFSGLLFALPMLPEESHIISQGKLESGAYIDLTETALRTGGIRFNRKEYLDGTAWEIEAKQRPQLPQTLSADGDWSNAAFFLCAGALSEHGITVHGLASNSAQGDREVLDLLNAFGADVRIGENDVTVCRGDLRPVNVEADAIPDLVPVISVLCCAAEGDSRISSAARLRLKESDRLRTTTTLIRNLGGNAEETADGLVIHGTGILTGGSSDTFNDHRIAMSAAMAASICTGPVHAIGAECVEKSYPAFWRDFESLQTDTDGSGR